MNVMAPFFRQGTPTPNVPLGENGIIIAETDALCNTTQAVAHAGFPDLDILTSFMYNNPDANA
jgi:hypothetical protein